MKKNIWYAVQNRDYDAWDDGSVDLEEAMEMARQQVADGREDVKIAVIDDDDQFCLEEITEF